MMFPPIFALLFGILSATAFAYPGDLDIRFAAAHGPSGQTRSIALHLDGSAVVGGFEFTIPEAILSRGPLVKMHPDGTFDPHFNPPLSGFATTLRAMPDGRTVAGGGFQYLPTRKDSLIVRLMPDGRLDPSFAINIATNGEIGSLVVQKDGGIVVGGPSFKFGGKVFNGLVRLKSDGTVDPTFDAGTGLKPRSAGGRAYLVYAMELDAEERVLIGGFFGSVDGVASPGIARLLQNGGPDTSFNPPFLSNSVVRSLRVLSDNRILVSGSLLRNQETNAILRLHPDGSIDPSFHASRLIAASETAIEELEIQPNGKLLLSGDPGMANWGIGSMVRLLPDGDLDPTFGLNHPVPFHSSFTEIELRPDGNVLTIGNFTEIQGVPRLWVAQLLGGEHDPEAPRLLSGPTNIVAKPGQRLSMMVRVAGYPRPSIQWLRDGEILPGATNASIELNSLTPRNSGSYLILASNSLGQVTGLVASVFMPSISTDAGTADPEFSPPQSISKVHAILERPHCGVLIASGARILRVLPDGTQDPRFVEVSPATGSVTALVETHSGKFLAAGSFSTSNGLIRLDADGVLDPSFTPDLTPVSAALTILAVDSEDRILLARSGSTSSLIRLLPTGLIDPSFTVFSGGPAAIRCLLVQESGRIVVGGFFNSWNGVPARNVVRLLSNGEVDPGFPTQPGADGDVFTVIADTDGRLLWGGRFNRFAGTQQRYLARTDANGIPDSTFVEGSASAFVGHLQFTSDSRILVGYALALSPASAPRTLISRLSPDGALDALFAPMRNDSRSTINCSVLTACGDWIVGGDFTMIGGVERKALSRIRLMGEPMSAPQIKKDPESGIVSVGATTLIGVIAQGGGVGYQWFQGISTLSGQTGTTLTVRGTEVGESHNFYAVATNGLGAVTSRVATIVTVDRTPAVGVHPQGQRIPEGGNATFIAGFAPTMTPLRFQWYRNGSPISGATNTVLRLPEVRSNEAGDYFLKGWNSSGTAFTVPARLRVASRIRTLNSVISTTDWLWGQGGLGGWLPDMTISADGDGSVRSGAVPDSGGETTLCTQVFGPGELHFQWRSSSRRPVHQFAFAQPGAAFQIISGETDWTSVTAHVSQGTRTLTWAYDKRGDDSAGADRAWLDHVSFLPSVSSAPTILDPPLSRVIVPGASLELSVFVEGTLPMRFQWFKDGMAMPGATNARLQIDAPVLGFEGSYTVSITNAVGGLLSPAAAVRAGTLPELGNPEWIDSRSVRMTVRGDIGLRYRLEASMELLTWIFVKDFIIERNPDYLNDDILPAAAQRFYRVVLAE